MQEPYFMNNQKISARQVKRTLTLELLGISTLLLPSLVATDSGVDGFFALTAGGGGAWLLLKFWQKHFRQQDFSQRLEQMSGCVRVCIQVIYGMGFLGLAGFVFYVMAALMEQQLLGNGWEPMILLTLAAGLLFWGRRPFRGLEAADIAAATVLVGPPDVTLELDAGEIETFRGSWLDAAADKLEGKYSFPPRRLPTARRFLSISPVLP